MPGKKKPGPSVKDPKVYEEIRETGRIKGQGGWDRQCRGGTRPVLGWKEGRKSGYMTTDVIAKTLGPILE